MLGNFEIYIHNDSSITTITDFLEAKNSIAGFFKGQKSDFLAYDGDTGKSNLDRIYSKYTEQEQEDNPKNSSIELLKPNTELIIPKTLLDKELFFIRCKDIFVKQSNFKAFYGEALKQLLSDPLYQQKVTYKYDQENTFTSIYPHISVWIYMGALNAIVNVSPFIERCSIQNSKQGGSFSFSLPPMVSIDEEDLYMFGEDNSEFYSSNHIKREDSIRWLESGDEFLNNEFYFHKLIQANDIVFIKFEQLEIEKDENLTNFILDKSVLANQFYDMIGLVDTNTRSTSYGNNNVSINITGRNFMKLLIDDGSYFFPLLFIDGADNTFINRQDDDKLIKRNFFTERYDTLFSVSYQSISDALQFIMNQLANLGVVDNDKVDLFSSYGERRTKVYRTPDDTTRPVLQQGVWQIIKLLVDSNVADRRLSDNSVSQPNSSLIALFNKVCQEPFVEFFIDNYGDTTDFIVRQPPFKKSAIIALLDGDVSDDNIILDENEGLNIKTQNLETEKTDLVLTIDPSDIISETLQWENDQIYTWYQLDPRRAFFGNQDSIPLAYLPIIYFPEYANKWGNRRLSLVTNYISHQTITGNGAETSGGTFKEAIINDYVYMLESHTYLPFTRKGTITINGDRRYKIGTWIRHGGTGEIFYVDSVANDFSISGGSIDRTTVLTVSRGMVEKYVRGSGGYSYFDIVDTKFIKETLLELATVPGGGKKAQPKTNIKSNFLVKPEIFTFFYERQQFR